MILPAGVIQSINDNGKNPVGGTITADQDIWSIDYSQLLDQPIYLAADTLNELRFLATSATITILKPDGSFCWAGFCELVADPVGWTGVTEIVPPALMTATGSTVVTLAWDGPGTNLVLDDGSVIPESSLTHPKSFYYSELPTSLANSTTNTSLVSGIYTSLPTDQAPGSPIVIKGNGTIKWNSLGDYTTWTFSLGANTLSTFTVAGTDLKVASTLSTYMWELDAQLNFLSVNAINANVQIVGTLKVYDDYVVLEIPINTTIVMDTTVNNDFNLQVQWSAASVNNVFVADWIKVFAMSITFGATTVPSTNYDGGQANTIYGGAILINGGNA